MKFGRVFSLGACVLAAVWLAPQAAQAFSVVSMEPNYNRFVVQDNEPLVLVFDQSLNPSTVGANPVTVTNLRTSVAVPGTSTLGQTNVANDTLTFTPTGGNFVFGRRLQVALSAALRDVDGGAFTGALPSLGVFVVNIPNNLSILAPGDITLSGAACLYGFNPENPEQTDPTKINYIPGMSVTEAWKITTGDPSTLIVVLDDGFANFTDTSLLNNIYLNKGELPQPEDANGTPCPNWDCNGDGKFSVEDYANDPRVGRVDGQTYVDLADVFAAFSDGVDHDHNGFVNDISGWDMFRNVNTPLGVDSFPEGDHGGGIARDAVQIADNGQGSRPGTCPDCSVLMVRVGDAVVDEFNTMAAGVDYARMIGADIIVIAAGAYNFSEEAQQAFIDAYNAGIFIVVASGDELGMQHIYPGAGEDVYSLKAIFPIPPVELFGPVNLSMLAFVESYCTNYGASIQASFSSDQCTSTATGNAAGMAGLLISYAKQLGLKLTPGEVRELLNMTADNIASNCFAFNLGGCQVGWGQNFGYGRANAKSALQALGDPLFGTPQHIPPDVRITEPLWWQTIDPSQTPTFDVVGQVNARGRAYQYAVQIGLGVEPLDAEFVTVTTGSGTAQTNGTLATVQPLKYVNDAWLRRIPAKINDFTVTVRVQAWYQADGQKVLGEARKAIGWHIDDSPTTGLLPGFPIEIGASGESSPLLYDLDGDNNGGLEIIFATAHSTVEVYKRNPTTGEFAPAPGFPVLLPEEGRWPDTVIASVAVGQLFGDGVPYIVVATWYGKVYVVHPDGNNHAGGPFLQGFPVSADAPDNSTALSYGHGNGFLASPVLADLDLDGVLEIIAASNDQKIYAWKPVPEGSKALVALEPGWPVKLDSSQAAGLVTPDKYCESNGPAEVLGTPAVGILAPSNYQNPDISGHPAVIVATTETCNEGLLPTSRVYAVYWNGMLNSNGPFLPGWPATPLAPLGNSLPIPPVTIGSTSSPAALMQNDQLLVGVGSFFWFPQMISWDGGATTVTQLGAGLNIASTGGGSFARFDDSGIPWYFFPTVGFLQDSKKTFYLESFDVAAWRVDTPIAGAKMVQHLEDINFFVNPLVAQVDGSGQPRMIAGSGGYLIHAVDSQQQEAAGWPKYNQGWTTGTPVVGDIDGDGFVEVVTLTHEGRLYAWRTQGPECNGIEPNGDWMRFHHDAYNSGFYGAHATPPVMTTDLQAFTTGDATSFDLRFTAPGDEGRCGVPASYDIRYATDASANLRDPNVWQTAAVAADAPKPQPGGTAAAAVVTAAGAKVFALRTIDTANLLSPISNLAYPTSPTDDDDDDDTADDDNADDDTTPHPGHAAANNKSGCGC
jgi:hypothetical protein